MKHNNFTHSGIVLFYLLFWTGFNFLFCTMMEQNFNQVSQMKIKILSSNLSALKSLKSDLLTLERSNDKRIPSYLQRFAYRSKELTWLANQKAVPLFGQLSISSNRNLTEQLLSKYNLKENYPLEESLGKIPNILTIQNNGQLLTTKTFTKQLQLFQKYQANTLLNGPVHEISEKLKEKNLMNRIYWIANIFLIFFLIILLHSMRKSTIWFNHHRWTVYKKLGAKVSSRNKNMLASSLLYLTLPIVFNIALLFFTSKYNIFFKFKISYSSIVRLFVFMPLLEEGSVLFSCILTQIRFKGLTK